MNAFGSAERRAGIGRSTAALGLAALVLLAFCIRALGFEWVFVGDTIVFPPGDAQYHVRRSLHAFVNFPGMLFWDTYINHPGGAAISWPPLFDFVVAAVGKLLVSGEVAFQRVAAWAPPVIGAATLVPVYFVGRALGSRALGLGSATLLALLPMSVTYSRVGQYDHHCAVAFIGACLLLVCVRIVSRPGGAGPPWGPVAALAAGRIAMLLTWHGSLLYLALVEATLWTAAAVSPRRELYAIQAASAAVTLAVVAPLVWLLPEPLGGAYSAIALSRLHLLAVLAIAAISVSLWRIEGRYGGPVRSAPARALRRLGWTAAFAVLALLVLLALPGPRQGLEPGLRFLTMTDGVGQITGEQLPLFPIFGRPTGRPAWEVWGGFAYAIPIAPFALLLAAGRRRGAAVWVLAGWCAFFGALAIVQRRYGNDLGPAAAVTFAFVLAAAARRLAALLRAGPRLAPWLAVAAAGVLLVPPVRGEYGPEIRSARRALGGEYRTGNRLLATPAGSLTRMMQQVREVTPETSGYFDFGVTPEYGTAAHANFGHALQNVARRATPADPFWAFIGRENWNRVFSLLGAPSEARAVALASELDARYVLTSSTTARDRLAGWLHWRDGLGTRGFAPSQHFRLVTEGPHGGVGLRGERPRAPEGPEGPEGNGEAVAAYKLFEVVAGALLRVRAAPGSAVDVALELDTPMRRTLGYRVRARADERGLAEIRVPYPSESEAEPAPRRPRSAAVRARGPYRIQTSEGLRSVVVTERAVQAGQVVEVAPRGS